MTDNTAQISALNELAKKIEAGDHDNRLTTCFFELLHEKYIWAAQMVMLIWWEHSTDAFIALFGSVLGDRWNFILSKHGCDVFQDVGGGRESHFKSHKDPAIAGLLALIAAKVSELETVSEMEVAHGRLEVDPVDYNHGRPRD